MLFTCFNGVSTLKSLNPYVFVERTIIEHGCTTVGKYYYFTRICAGQQRRKYLVLRFVHVMRVVKRKWKWFPARFRLVSSSHRRYVINCVCYALIVITHALKTAKVATYCIRIIIIIIIVTTYYVVKICIRIEWTRSCSRSIVRAWYSGVIFERNETVKVVIEVLE